LDTVLKLAYNHFEAKKRKKTPSNPVLQVEKSGFLGYVSFPPLKGVLFSCLLHGTEVTF